MGGSVGSDDHVKAEASTGVPAWRHERWRSRKSSVARLKVSGSSCSPGVRKVVEYDQLAPGDPAVERLGEARGADEVARPERDQRRNVDVA